MIYDQSGAAMSDYVRRGGLDVQPPPWVCKRIDAQLFGVPAARNALQVLCDRTLNAPSGGRLQYVPSLNFVVLTFQRMDGLYSSSPQAWAPVALSYNEASFWVMVHEKADRAPESPQLLVPFIFLDNGLAVAAGREIYGFPKEQATLAVDYGGRSAYAISCLTAASLAAQSPSKPSDLLLTCDFAAFAPLANAFLDTPPPPEVYDENAEFVSIRQKAQGLAAYVQMLRIGLHLPFVFLRQIRALAGGSACDLQQIVSAAARLSNVDLPSFAGLYELNISSKASHPVAQNLGLARSPVIALGAAIGFGFELGPGTAV